MRKFLSLHLLLMVILPAVAQKKIPDFGVIDPAELRLASSPFETNASALKLFDITQVEFEPTGLSARMETERRVRIKIFDQKGFKHAAIRIPYYSRRGNAKIKDIEGIVYNLDDNGNIITRKLQEEDFFKEKIQKRVGMVTFTFPDLKAGSVIEFRYKKIERNGTTVDSWTPQEEYPTSYASMEIVMPTFSRLHKKVVGFDTLAEKKETIRKGYTRQKISYYRENIPSFVPEPFMNSRADNLYRAIFMLIKESNELMDALISPESSWHWVTSIFMNSPDFGQQLKKPIPGTSKIIDSAKLISAVPERINYLRNAIHNRISDVGEQTFFPGDIIEAWESRNATTAELNMMLLNFLKATGITCHPLMISTRDNGYIDIKFPAMGQANGLDVFVQDGDNIYIIDASDKFQSVIVPPLNILNRNAYLMESGRSYWMVIEDGRPLLKQSVIVQGTFTEKGTIEGDVYGRFFDYTRKLILDTAEGASKENKFFDKNADGLVIHSRNFTNENNTEVPLEIKSRFTYEPQEATGFYIISPQSFSGIGKNSFISDTRTTDIDFGSNQEHNLRLYLTIPATLEPDHLPKNILLRSPDSTIIFKRTVVVDDSTIHLNQTFEVKKAIFSKDQYGELKEFFKMLYELLAEEIILRRRK